VLGHIRTHCVGNVVCKPVVTNMATIRNYSVTSNKFSIYQIVYSSTFSPKIK
jgi:hypothetical protein